MYTILEFLAVFGCVSFFISFLITMYLHLKNKIDHWAYPASFAVFTTLVICILMSIKL